MLHQFDRAEQMLIPLKFNNLSQTITVILQGAYGLLYFITIVHQLSKKLLNPALR